VATGCEGDFSGPSLGGPPIASQQICRGRNAIEPSNRVDGIGYRRFSGASAFARDSGELNLSAMP
jgi:hypothetical protein